MKIPVLNSEGGAAGEFDLRDDFIIKGSRGQQTVRDAVVAIQSNRRSGTACTKTLGEVAGSGKKPWKQKGTGRARAGSFASPLWRGGGVVFGPKPRDWSLGMPKKVRRLALQKAIGERIAAGDVVLVDAITLKTPKTKEFVSVVKNLKAGNRSILLVVDKPEKNLMLASGNVAFVSVVDASNLNVYDVTLAHKLVFMKSAFEKVEQRLAKD
ncbi:MAG: 50S ribosomal protein L4 [Verrucomicrobia bacterium]|nr:50S ribosomal protein L4 [Verrucomicrobiota bacterium]